MRRLFLTIGNILIYCVNLAVSLGCDLLDNVTMVKHGLILTTRRRTSARQLTLSGHFTQNPTASAKPAQLAMARPSD